jgi:uncharacterized protein DUF4336
MPSLLRPLGPNLWVVDRTMRNGPFEFGVRMSVIRLRNGGLVLHSPVALDQALRAELDALGPVRGAIAPDMAHHLFVADYQTGYPDAELFAAPGLPRKRPDLKFAAELSDEAPALWAAELEQHLVRGAPQANEVVFFHPESRTAIFTDLVFNLPAETRADNLVSRLFFALMGAAGRFGPHRIMRWFFIRDRKATRDSIDRILRWDFDRVVMSHGDVLERGGKAAVREAFAYLG